MKFSPIISEHQEAKVFVEWLKLNPFLWEASQTSANQAICYAHEGVRKKMTDEGVKAGEPDFSIRIMARGYGGLFIELKSVSQKGKKLRPEQEKMHNILRKNGYYVHVSYGANEAIAIVKDYVSGRL